MIVLAFALAVTAGLVACAASQTCPCGEQFDRDPFDDSADFFIGADHALSDHCFCQCGDDPEQRMPPSRTCSAYEGPCERLDRTVAQLACR
jgi:hypothetical protein